MIRLCEIFKLFSKALLDIDFMSFRRGDLLFILELINLFLSGVGSHSCLDSLWIKEIILIRIHISFFMIRATIQVFIIRVMCIYYFQLRILLEMMQGIYLRLFQVSIRANANVHLVIWWICLFLVFFWYFLIDTLWFGIYTVYDSLIGWNYIFF